MSEIRRRKFDRAAWIPLRASVKSDNGIENGTLGFEEEFFGLGSVAIPVEHKEAAEGLGWNDAGIGRDQRGYVQDGEYVAAQRFGDYRGVQGEHLALSQQFSSPDVSEWHLSQDLVLTLGLKREGDAWVRPEEGYLEVARLTRNGVGGPSRLEVRASHLRDYLCARQMALYLTSYRSRIEIVETAAHIAWPEGRSADKVGDDEWEGHVGAIHEGGMPFGEGVSVLHFARTDVDPEEDAPTMGLPSDGNVRSDSWVERFEGRKLHRVFGQLWKNEWVEPAADSPIVRRDRVAASTFFIVDTAGKREAGDSLVSGDGRWLWFRPNVVSELLRWRNSSLAWYTRETGGVSCSPGSGMVHFGLNERGLVTVYAKDIGLLPEWQQRIWAASNVAPEGGVSRELLLSQVDAEPAETQAAEAFLSLGLEALDRAGIESFGSPLLRDHEKTEELLAGAHRFRATDLDGLLALAKDLARLTADSLDVAAMQKVTAPPKGEKWGSLKSLEKVLATKTGDEKAKEVVAPLHHILNLRHADAHLPGSAALEPLERLGIPEELPLVFKGELVVRACVSCLFWIAEALKEAATVADLRV